MKRWIAVLCAALALCLGLGCLAEEAGNSAWKLDYYLDEFRQPTGDAHLISAVPFEGIFTNSAAVDAELRATIIVDGTGVFYAEANEAFLEAGSYSDAAVRAGEPYYKQAEALLAEGDLAHAAMTFGSIADCADARQRSMEKWNQIGRRDTISACDGIICVKNDGTPAMSRPTLLSENGDASDWTDIVAISAGKLVSLGLKRDGTIAGCGYGLGDLSDRTNIVAIDAGTFYAAGLRSDGTAVTRGYKNQNPGDISDWTGIVAISLGYEHLLGLKPNGTLVVVGDGLYGKWDVLAFSDIRLPRGIEFSYPTLQRGDKGESVKALQQRLIELGYLDDSADGDFGGKSEAAVKDFQQANGLEPTGVADDATQQALFSDAAVAK